MHYDPIKKSLGKVHLGKTSKLTVNFSQVYKATHNVTGKVYALKRIKMDNEKDGVLKLFLY